MNIYFTSYGSVESQSNEHLPLLSQKESISANEADSLRLFLLALITLSFFVTIRNQLYYNCHVDMSLLE